MKKMMKKMLTMALVCAMIISFSGTFVFAANEGDFVISSLATGVKVPAGKTVTIGADALPEGTAKLAVYRSTNGTAIGALAAEAEASDGKASVQVELSTADAYFVAQAKAANGAILGTSNALVIKGSYERETDVRWDLDFSSHSIGAHRWGGGYLQLNDNATGTAAYSGPDYFTAHRGNESNTIEIIDTGDAAHGVALHFAAADTAQVQLNEFMVTHSGSVLKYEEDVMVDALPTGGTKQYICPMQVILAGDVWLDPVDVAFEGEDIYFRHGDITSDAKLNTWYNLVCYVDLENCVYSYYIDGALFATGKIAEGITGGQKFAPRLMDAPGASMWIDNFKASAVSISPDGLGFDLLANIQNANVPAGKKVNLVASYLPEGSARVEFCTATFDGVVKEIKGSVETDSDTAEFAYEVSNGTNTVLAISYDEAGSPLGKSNRVTFWGYFEKQVETRWDVDFEDEYAGVHRWGAPYVAIYGENGAALSSNGDTLTAHTGTADNVIATEPATDTAHGKALRFYAADTNQVQLNEFASTLGGDVLVWEWDWVLSKLPATGSDAVVQIMGPVVATGNWMSSVLAKVSGDTIAICAGASSIPAALNTWYNIKAYADLSAAKYTVYVDDVVLYSTTISTGLTNGQKVVANLSNATGGEMWIDNYKMYSMTVTQNPPPVSISAACSDSNAIGKKTYTFTAGNLPDETAEVVFYKADAEGNKISEIGKTKNAKLDITLNYGANYIVAQALDAYEEVCNSSEVFAVNAKYESVSEVRWDIDFEGEYAAAHRWGAPYVTIYGANGAALSSNGDTLTAHTGTADNVIATEPAADTAHGTVLKFEARDTAKVQLNEFHASPTGSVIKYELDYMIEKLPTTGADAKITVMQPVMAGGNWLSSLSMKVDGEALSFVSGSNSLPASVGTWYEIDAYADLENATITYYIDGTLFASASIATGIIGGQKLVSMLDNAAGGIAWLDNYKVSALSFADPALSLAAVDYKIDGADAEKVAAGHLFVVPTVSNDGKERGVVVYAAVYSTNENSVKKLVGVKMAKYSFGENEIEHTFDAIDMGTLVGDETVKVMLWSEERKTPLDAASVLE